KRCGPTSGAAISSRQSSRTRSATAATAASSRLLRSAPSETAARRTPHVTSRGESTPRHWRPATCDRRLRGAMTRVVSGALLIAFAVGVVWFASSVIFLIVAAALVGLGVNELVVLARASQLNVAFWPALVPALLVLGSVGAPGRPLEVALMA